jgi:hypothetical protein
MILSVIVGMLLMALLVHRYLYMLRPRAFPVNTIKRIVHSILKQSETISSLQSPQIALVQSRECQASLYTLIHLIEGGTTTLDSICGIDTVGLQNILYFQEKQIRDFIQNQIDT